MSGPVPKRSTQRRRVNKTEIPIDNATAGDAFDWPAPDEYWCDMAKDWFASLGKSGQATFYERSDLQMARVAGEVLSRMLTAPRLSSTLLASWIQLSAALLTTEGDRRRLRIELERPQPVDTDAEAAVSAIDDYRARLTS